MWGCDCDFPNETWVRQLSGRQEAREVRELRREPSSTKRSTDPWTSRSNRASAIVTQWRESRRRMQRRKSGRHQPRRTSVNKRRECRETRKRLLPSPTGQRRSSRCQRTWMQIELTTKQERRLRRKQQRRQCQRQTSQPLVILNLHPWQAIRYEKRLKIYQFKTHCKGNSHSSKTAIIILPGLMVKQRWTDLMAASEMVFKFIELHYVGWNNSSHPNWIAYYFACRCKVENAKSDDPTDMEAIYFDVRSPGSFGGIGKFETLQLSFGALVEDVSGRTGHVCVTQTEKNSLSSPQDIFQKIYADVYRRL